MLLPLCKSKSKVNREGFGMDSQSAVISVTVSAIIFPTVRVYTVVKQDIAAGVAFLNAADWKSGDERQYQPTDVRRYESGEQ
jgi:hypothetical protein